MSASAKKQDAPRTLHFQRSSGELESHKFACALMASYQFQELQARYASKIQVEEESFASIRVECRAGDMFGRFKSILDYDDMFKMLLERA